jgi:hypothetical protein
MHIGLGCCHTHLVFWEVCEAEVVHDIPAMDRETKWHQLSVRLVRSERLEGRILSDSAPESRQRELQSNNKVTGKQNLDVITRTIYFQRTYLIAKPASAPSHPSPHQSDSIFVPWNRTATQRARTPQQLLTKKLANWSVASLGKEFNYS